MTTPIHNQCGIEGHNEPPRTNDSSCGRTHSQATLGNSNQTQELALARFQSHSNPSSQSETQRFQSRTFSLSATAAASSEPSTSTISIYAPDLTQQTMPSHFSNPSTVTSATAGNSLSERPAEMATLQSIKQELERWKSDPEALGNKKLASERILEAFELQSTHLGLDMLGLTSLPDCVSDLRNLKTFNLSYNELTNISISNTLTALETLHICFNKLTTVSIPTTLIALKSLWLSDNSLTAHSLSFLTSLTALQFLRLDKNSLTALPLSFLTSLTALRSLFLNDNQLETLPPEIGNLSSLSRIFIHNNFGLQTLPISLGQICGITTLNTCGTLIPDNIRDSILASCAAKRSRKAVDRLPSQLELWRASANIDKTFWSLMSTFDDEDKTAVYEWLVRLAKSSDFRRHQQDLAKIVCGILQNASQESFKEVFLNQIRANNECCQDRAAMALNELYVAWCLLCPQQELSDKEQLKLLLGAGKTLALRAALGEILQKKSHVEPEGVEIYLYYESQLRKKLGLLTAIQSMSYKRIGRRDWIDEEDLIKTVQNSYTDHVVALPIFDQFLQKDEDAKQEIEGINEKALDELEQIGPCPKKNENSPEVLEWNIKQTSSKNELESQLKQYKKTWLKALSQKEGLV